MKRVIAINYHVIFNVTTIRDWSFILEDIRTISHILFFLTTGIIAVLTYLNARKTILQPLRTEVYKKQIDELTKLMDFFVGKHETELRKQWGFDSIYALNITDMMNAFVRTNTTYDKDEPFFKHSHYEEDRSTSAIISPEFLELVSAYDNNNDNVESKPQKKQWDDYKHPQVVLSNTYNATNAEFQLLMDSPILPKVFYEKLEAYQMVVYDNLTNVKKALDKVAPTLKEVYDSSEKITSVRNFAWIENEINKEFKHLEPYAKEIINYIREYAQSDNIYSGSIKLKKSE